MCHSRAEPQTLDRVDGRAAAARALLLLLLVLLVSQVDAPTPARSKVSQSSKHCKLANHPTTEMDIETVIVGYHTYPARRPRA